MERLKASIKTLTETKEDYENKTQYAGEDIDLSRTQIETYKIEFLWTIIGNYAQKRNLILTLNLRQGTIEDAYDLDFALSGSYVGIINFLYDLENDDRLNFKIENFVIAPGGTINRASATSNNTTGTTEQTSEQSTNAINNATNNTANNTANNQTTATTGGDTSNLNASFTVSEVGITLE